MAFAHKIREEELKLQVAESVFFAYDCTRIIGNIDFAVYPHADEAIEPEAISPHVWAEAKRSVGDLDEALVQLLLTIGKARTFDRYNPPKYLSGFNAEGIAFIEYSAIHEVFYQNDFNWSVVPNDHTTKEFRQLAELVKDTLGNNALRFEWNAPALSLFIRRNFNTAQTTALLQIDDRNFITLYTRWRKRVMPSIDADWDEEKKDNILDADFYLADLLSRDNHSLLDKLKVLLTHNRYKLVTGRGRRGRLNYDEYEFKDAGKAHADFWRMYQRPPEEKFWDEIIQRRDLLVPEDVREYKGAFFTPLQWVELSQQYLAEHLGQGWQDEYYIWDCAAGTGNLLQGLTNPANVWASTLDQADVNIMHQLIDKGANLYHNHVFQFDFLNDGWEKLPEGLRAIVETPERRARLVVYINPPYAEAATTRTASGTGSNKRGVAKNTRIAQRYSSEMGAARNELFAQFLFRIYREIPGCTIGNFSTLKVLLGANFAKYLQAFQAQLAKLFLVPGQSFDNVRGTFPIGFFIWDTQGEQKAKTITADVYSGAKIRIGKKRIALNRKLRYINSWYSQFYDSVSRPIGTMHTRGNDFQNAKFVRVSIADNHNHTNPITLTNLLQTAVYFAARHCISKNWLNNQDQFLWPKKVWEKDREFQDDCLAYLLLHGQNRVMEAEGVNHWIPYPEQEVGLRNAYTSHFMIDYIAGKQQPRYNGKLFGDEPNHEKASPIVWSPEAQVLMDAGRVLWQYYHSRPNAKPNASFYDIRLHFQGVGEEGRMNTKSEDTEYSRLIKAIRDASQQLAETKIIPKVYEYGFLMQ